MSAVIKSKGRKGKKQISSLQDALANKANVVPGVLSEAAVPMDPRLEEISRLNKALEKAEAEVEQGKKASEEAVKKAYEEGRAAALLSIEKNDKENLALLKTNLEALSDSLDKQMASTDLLSLAIAQAALRNLFESEESVPEIVVNLIKRQLRDIRQKLITEIVVSQSDFPDAQSLDDLIAQFGSGFPIKIRSQGNMKSGDCRIELRLGYIDLSLKDYWEDLCFLCEEIANEAGRE